MAHVRNGTPPSEPAPAGAVSIRNGVPALVSGFGSSSINPPHVRNGVPGVGRNGVPGLAHDPPGNLPPTRGSAIDQATFLYRVGDKVGAWQLLIRYYGAPMASGVWKSLESRNL